MGINKRNPLRHSPNFTTALTRPSPQAASCSTAHHHKEKEKQRGARDRTRGHMRPVATSATQNLLWIKLAQPRAPLQPPFCLGMPVLPTFLLNSHSTFCLSHSCVSVSHNNTNRLWCWQSRGFPRAVWLVQETCSEMCENLLRSEYVGLFSSNLGTYCSQKLDKANKTSHCCMNWLVQESLISQEVRVSYSEAHLSSETPRFHWNVI